MQALTLKLNSLKESCTSLKSIVQLTKTIFPGSAIFIEKKTVENQLWAKSEFLGPKQFIITYSRSHLTMQQPLPLTLPWAKGLSPVRNRQSSNGFGPWFLEQATVQLSAGV